MIFNFFKKPHVSIAESNLGTFFYHLSTDGGKTAICGDKRVMPTNFTVWGFRGHLNERYCAACGKKQGIGIENVTPLPLAK